MERSILKRSKIIPMILVVVIGICAFTGCIKRTESGIKSGFEGSSGDTYEIGSFEEYNGHKKIEIPLKEGETIYVDYKFESEFGSVSLKLAGDGEEIYSGEGEDEGKAEYLAEKRCRFVVELDFNAAKNGSYDIEWEII
jgi:hypothetical protein